MASLEQLTKSILLSLAPRQRDIIVRRFGLDGKDPLTLAELGTRYKVTRERVRQIEAAVLGQVNAKIKGTLMAECVEFMGQYLESQGGVRRADYLLVDIAKKFEGLSMPALAFLMEASKQFNYTREDNDYYEFWYKDKNTLKKATRLIDRFYKELKAKKQEVLGMGSADAILSLVSKSEGVSDDVAKNYVSISKKFGVSVYGDFGLAEWSEIQPRTVRDQAYLVLRKQKSPLHFSDITGKINSLDLGKKKVANVSTVHNELIKDSRFVLVGRGMYALSEHGYEPGTAKEVIQKLLKEQGSLHPHRIVSLVSERRFFKKNTILLNLQNKKMFRRLEDGTYTLA